MAFGSIAARFFGRAWPRPAPRRLRPAAPLRQANPGVRTSAGALDPLKASSRSYKMKKSINLWAFPYPERMTLRECLQLAKDAGFDGIELNYDLENDLSPRPRPTSIERSARRPRTIGIAISGVCSFLYWPYSLTDNDPARRDAGSGAGPDDDRGRPRAGN